MVIDALVGDWFAASAGTAERRSSIGQSIGGVVTGDAAPRAAINAAGDAAYQGVVSLARSS
jgi:hypothetical protein